MGMQISDEVSDYGPEHARDVTPAETAPRRGGVVYRDPEPTPATDTIEDAEATAGDDLFPTPEQRAAAEAEAMAAIKAQEAAS
jgi:hypothetical protein